MTIGNLLKEAIKYLKENNVEDPSMEAGLLLSYAMDRDRSYIYAHSDEELDDRTVEKCRSYIERRGRHEPFAYITGECGFLDLTFFVDRHVLIPREETELLAQSALWALGKSPVYFNQNMPRLPDKDVYRVLDLGTGSGCLAVSIAKYCDSAFVDALDISADAIDIARRNAARHNVENRMNFIVADFPDNFQNTGKYDLVVSNPPYIPENEIELLSDSVKKYEPHIALAAGNDGLGFYRALAERALSLLYDHGLIIVECGFDQGRKVREIFSKRNMETVILKDLAGIERIVAAARQ